MNPPHETKKGQETAGTFPRKKFLVLNVFKDIETKPEGQIFKSAAISWLKTRMSAAEFQRLRIRYNNQPKLNDLFKEVKFFMYTFGNYKLVREARRRKISESEFNRNINGAIINGLSAYITPKTQNVKLLLDKLKKANKDDPYPMKYMMDVVEKKLEITQEVLKTLKQKLPEFEIARALGLITQKQLELIKKIIINAENKLKTQDPFIAHLKKIEREPTNKNALKKIKKVLYKWMQGQVGGDEFKRINFRLEWRSEEGQALSLNKIFKEAFLIMYTRNKGKYLKLFKTAKGTHLKEAYNKCLNEFSRELRTYLGSRYIKPSMNTQEKKVFEEIIKYAGLSLQR